MRLRMAGPNLRDTFRKTSRLSLKPCMIAMRHSPNERSSSGVVGTVNVENVKINGRELYDIDFNFIFDIIACNRTLFRLCWLNVMRGIWLEFWCGILHARIPVQLISSCLKMRFNFNRNFADWRGPPRKLVRFVTGEQTHLFKRVATAQFAVYIWFFRGIK